MKKKPTNQSMIFFLNLYRQKFVTFTIIVKALMFSMDTKKYNKLSKRKTKFLYKQTNELIFKIKEKKTKHTQAPKINDKFFISFFFFLIFYIY